MTMGRPRGSGRVQRELAPRMAETVRDAGSFEIACRSRSETICRYRSARSVAEEMGLPLSVHMRGRSVKVEYDPTANPPSVLVALYRGDELVEVGTVAEVAEAAGLPEETVRWYATPTARRRRRRTEVVRLS